MDSFKINLQLFGDDDAILPEDFTPDASPQAETEVEPVTEEPIPEVAPSEPTQEPVQQSIKVKFNHEEKEIPMEEAAILAQKGMNYDKVIEKLNALQSNPALNFVERQAQRFGMSVDEYIQAVRQSEEQEELNELVQKNVPEEYAKEMLENRKFREQYVAEQQAKATKERKSAEYKDFLNLYGNVKPEDIPTSVWEAESRGVPLKYAYMQHERETLLSKVKVLEQNAANTKKAPVHGTTVHGSGPNAAKDPFEEGFDSIV